MPPRREILEILGRTITIHRFRPLIANPAEILPELTEHEESEVDNEDEDKAILLLDRER